MAAARSTATGADDLCRAGYCDLASGGIAIWPRAGFTEPEVRGWQRALVREAQADGLRAELSWFHLHDVWFHPAVTLVRPDGCRYRYSSENHWPRPSQPPPREPAVEELRLLIEADWGQTLQRARARATRPGR